ncbi:MAG: translation initiation factor IF-2, partial [Phycisphaerae bacterium]
AASPRTSEADGALEKLKEWRDQDLIERRERLEGATGRKVHRRRAMESHGGLAPSAPAGRRSEAQVHEPILVKEFCSAVGIPFIRLVKILQKEHNLLANINTTLPTAVAELVALSEGIELKVIKAKTQLEVLQEEFDGREVKKLSARPPVVTLLGHVDHGKTSLLDAIRSAKVASGEDGGITQHLTSYHLKREGLAITFLDTPGHAAFTAMRARGAQLTDIVVLIVAADDGVMPQTIEAINHAKAAGVPIVVAITKHDLGVFDEARVFGQLTEHGLTPSGDWGGEIDVIKTSAVTGEGLDDLLEHLAALAEVLDLKADFGGAPAGAVVEAETREGVGAAVRVLVQRGQLTPGAIVVCGNSYGKVRAILDDQGKRLKSAGPSIPCEIWGLDQVPSAGDKFFGVKSMQRAKSIAEETRHRRTDEARIGSQKALTLEDVFKQRDAEGTPELKLIIRTDMDGSMHALKDSLAELPTDQIKLDILHAGVGAVTDSDVLLAHTSGSIVIAFRVSSAPATRRLAEEHGVDIREYKVIYHVIEDITKAMEGLLEPEKTMERRATIEVREVFKITKVGAVAGCYVTDGLVSRNHRVRLVREGVIIREDNAIGSLRRFKDDVKEVRAGMECGIRLDGFGDLKQGDIIEALEVVEVARKL